MHNHLDELGNKTRKDCSSAPAVVECKPWPTYRDLIVNCIKFGAPGVKLRKPDTSLKHIALK